MGKNLIQQRRGKGSTVYRAPSHRFKGRAEHLKLSAMGTANGKVLDIISCPAHSAPLVVVEQYDRKQNCVNIAAEGIRVGDVLQSGNNAELRLGNSIPLGDIPEGTSVYNIESNPGDGGKYVRASGVFAKVISKLNNKVIVLLPSKKQKSFNLKCRACIGIVAGGGRKEKPFLKAGNRYYFMKSKNKLYPSVSGTSMNSVDHPFGGSSSSNKGRPTIAPKNAPPGRKVGMIRPRRSGRKKR